MQNYGRDPDLLWTSRNITIWTVTECNIGIVSGNLPSFKPLFQNILGVTYGSRTAQDACRTPGTSGNAKDMPYGGNAIKLNTRIGGSRALRADDVSETGSTESQEAFAKMGGITRTNEVNVIRGSSVKESDEDIASTARRE